MSLFTRLASAATAFTAPIDNTIVKVTRTTMTVEVRPGMTVEETALASGQIDYDQFSFATFKIRQLSGCEMTVDLNHICEGGEELVITLNADSKGV